MTAIADQSTMPVWSPTVWLAIGFVALMVGAFLYVLSPRFIDRLEHHEDTGPLDHWDGRGWRPCHLHNDGCHTVGTIIRRERPELGGQQVLVCPGHDATGQRKGWWVA